jgi:hypothetical protein
MAVDSRLIVRPGARHTPSATPGWLAGQLGWIQPGSGSARPDPACPLLLPFLFFSVWFKSDIVLYFKVI